MNTIFTLPWESRALGPGEGPARPLWRPTLPLRGRVKRLANVMQKYSFADPYDRAHQSLDHF